MPYQISEIHDFIVQLQKRADKIEESVLLKTFVNAGPLLPSLKSRNNQILYGRRGTGKTHVLQVLRSAVENESIVEYVDIRTLGSSSSLYHDANIPIEQRAISLFKDFLDAVYNGILDYIQKHLIKYSEIHDTLMLEMNAMLSFYGPDVLFGKITDEISSETAKKTHLGIEANYSRQAVGSKSSVNACADHSKEITVTEKSSIAGDLKHYINYNAVTTILMSILDKLDVSLYLLVDEFSELPAELQICLADMFRHVLCPNKHIVFKIAAIEYRTVVYEKIQNGYRGLEVGADVFSLNLDDLMVFGNNKVRALTFFRELLLNHINCSVDGGRVFKDSNEMVQTLFTQENVFCELVDAAEGVPRDAINLLCEAVLVGYSEKISMPMIRKAAKEWYKKDKYSSVSRYPQAADILTWIITTVIGKRKAKAFLLKVGHHSELIDYLFDCRILHIIKQNVSGKDRAGERFDVYAIDYGCYVDLMNTKNNPMGLFQEDDADDAEYVQVPKDDYRSIRRAVLELNQYPASN